jgi:uncharacterized protein DUF3617
MRRITFPIVFFLMLSIAASVLAAERMKPGLWLIRIKSDAMTQMQQMSPQQMEILRQRGINPDGTMESRVCMTKEMTERDRPPVGKSQKDCHMDSFERSGNTYTVKMVCDGPNMQGTIVTKGVHSGLENYSWVSDMKGTAHGHKINSHQEGSGKWLGTDCGNVKPMPDYVKEK